MALSGGMLAAYVISKGDAFWTFSGGLAGLITASAGNDLYHPIQAMLIGAIGVVIVYKLHFWVEKRFKIDDAVGAVGRTRLCRSRWFDHLWICTMGSPHHHRMKGMLQSIQ